MSIGVVLSIFADVGVHPTGLMLCGVKKKESVEIWICLFVKLALL